MFFEIVIETNIIAATSYHVMYTKTGTYTESRSTITGYRKIADTLTRIRTLHGGFIRAAPTRFSDPAFL